MAHRILVVDDEPHIREVICFALERAGMSTSTARNGKEALIAFRREALDLAVLDVGMPEMDGLEVCRQIRKSSDLPILFLSARDEEIDRVLGLEIGGDDYVTKPFSPRELVARINVILRRAKGAQRPDKTAALARGPVRLDNERHSVMVDGQELGLTGLEFAIIEALLARPEHVLSRDQLMTAAYGPGMHVAERTIDSHVRNIRAKFAEAGCHGVIATVHGVGFRFGLGEEER
ncbi:MAG TPA: response regulator transcription factor [Devosiaceae bacterium]|jgi:two-component system OmpR family response regulator